MTRERESAIQYTQSADGASREGDHVALESVDLCSLEGTLGDAATTALGESLERFGFVNLLNHGISWEDLELIQTLAGALFASPLEEKLRCADPARGYQRGYTPMRGERARDQRVGDLKEFWHIGRSLDRDDPIFEKVGPNRFPEDSTVFKAHALRLFERLEEVARFVLRAIARHLRLSEVDTAYLSQIADQGNSVLRVIHYPSLTGGEQEGVRAAAHEDINLLTLLPTASKPGLQLLDRAGNWRSIEAPRGALICDTGDMMALLTGGRLPATTHRVVNPPNDDGGRISTPFFLHPHPTTILRPIFGESTPRRAHEFLKERLRENGLL